MKHLSAKVIENRQVLKELERRGKRNILGSFIIWLRCPEIAKEAKPGQFVMVCCGKETFLPRPFSIHQINDQGEIALLYAVLEGGRGTNWLSSRRSGDSIELFGPLGNGFSVSPTSHNLLLVAGGIGIAPLAFLAHEASKRGFKIKLLLGASGERKPSGEANPSQLYPRELLPPQIEVETIISSPDGKRNLVTDLIPRSVPWADEVFACGPTPMYHEMVKKKEELGLQGKAVQISLEARMGCGRGICFGCTIKTKGGLKKVCQDGPVFELDDIIWESLA